MKKNCKNQREYYWRHRDEILKKIAEKLKDPEYRETHRKNALKSYYKRKEEKCQSKKQSLMTDDGNTKSERCPTCTQTQITPEP